MQFELRNYQLECVEHIEEHFKEKKKCLIQLPTGSGKTVILWAYLFRNPKKCIIIVPSVQLGEQVYLMGLNFFPKENISCYFGKYREKPKMFHITTVHSIVNKLEKFQETFSQFESVIIDEAHKAGASSYLNILRKIDQKVFIIGFTATPFRNDAINLQSVIGPIIYSKDLLELIHENYLCDLEGYRIKTDISIKKAAYSNGDFTSHSLFKILNITQRNQLIYESFIKHCINLKTLIFAINIEHCLIIENFFIKNGIKARAIYGSMALPLREQILEEFKNSNIQVLINAQLLTEGFDAPWIEALIIARPTMSKILYMQMIGRGVRLYKNKTICKVIELSDNYHNLINFKSLCHNQDTLHFDLDYEDGITITSLKKKVYEIDLKIIDRIEEKINFFIDDEDFFNQIAPEYLKKECGYDFLTYFECLFLLWKKQKIKEFKIDGQY